MTDSTAASKPSPPKRRLIPIIFLLLLLLSAGLKLYAARLLAWEADYVPLITRGQAWLDGGAFPAVGTLSSVAAYNMPFLVWMQLPALLITRDVRFVLVATQLVFNLVGSAAIFRFGRALYNERAALMGATLFTFSEVSISGAYTAWAQLQLPIFFALFAFSLYLWLRDGRSWQLASCWIIATAAFMTHFSAVTLYAVLLLLWLLLRPSVDRRGLAVGLFVSMLMLAPYLAFDAGDGFGNMTAFITRSSRLSEESLAESAHLKPEARSRAARDSTADAPSGSASARQDTRLERGLSWALRIPAQVVRSLRLAFSTNLNSLQAHSPVLYQPGPALCVPCSKPVSGSQPGMPFTFSRGLGGPSCARGRLRSGRCLQAGNSPGRASPRAPPAGRY